ncbi:MFS general substrate transporter [Xylariomycetidae sp. FL2044]|nr:MFS general substrate transporter [Xylariomycetidae sp. FL2044]
MTSQYTSQGTADPEKVTNSCVEDVKAADDGLISAINHVDPDGLAQPDWTPAEEAALRRKIDRFLLPLLALGFFALQMDRINIGNALTDTILQDLNITTNQINVGNQLMSAGIILLEIPSNIILQKVGPQKWLSFQILAWSTVATLQVFINNYGSYLATRVLLGLLESGYIPGALYTLSTWYKRDETSLRVSLFFLGNLLAAATVSLIGAGILTLSGRHGIAGWRWLFLIEGAISIAFGLLATACLPKRPDSPVMMITGNRRGWLTERERHIAVARVVLDDPQKALGAIEIKKDDLFSTFAKPHIWLHVLICVLSNTPVNALQTYTPSIIKSLGFDTTTANALNAVPLFIAILLVLCLSKAADRTGHRGPFALIGQLWALIAYICMRESRFVTNKWNHYASVVASGAVNSVVHILNIGWLSLNCKTPQERSVAMAMIIMAANCGGLIGAQVFRSEDAPVYQKAFTIVLALAAACITVLLAQLTGYLYSNRKTDRSANGHVADSRVEDGALRRDWRWTW